MSDPRQPVPGGAHRVFGTKKPVIYHDRHGAYVLPVREGLFGVVRIPKGLFLIGGGIEPGESEEECISRECAEETGWSVRIDSFLCSAETFTVHSEMGPFHPMQSYYLGTLLAPDRKRVETDHTLLWMRPEDLFGRMFSEMQNWAVEEAFRRIREGVAFPSGTA